MDRVKSGKDKLSQNQKNWIKDNYECLQLPFKLVKIHNERTEAKPTHSHFKNWFLI